MLKDPTSIFKHCFSDLLPLPTHNGFLVRHTFNNFSLTEASFVIFLNFSYRSLISELRLRRGSNLSPILCSNILAVSVSLSFPLSYLLMSCFFLFFFLASNITFLSRENGPSRCRLYSLN